MAKRDPFYWHQGTMILLAVFIKKAFFCQIIMASPVNNNVPEGRSVLTVFLKWTDFSAKTLDKKSNDGGDSSSSLKLSAWQHLDESLWALTKILENPRRVPGHFFDSLGTFSPLIHWKCAKNLKQFWYIKAFCCCLLLFFFASSDEITPNWCC